jgi:hypothetical protein
MTLGEPSEWHQAQRKGDQMTQTTRRRRSAALAVLMATALLLAGCSGSDDAAGTADSADGVAAPELAGVEDDRAQAQSGGDSAASSGPMDSPVLADRSVIYTVDLVVETDDVRRARNQAEAIAARFGGYVQSEGTYGVPNPPLGSDIEGSTSLYPSADEQATLVLRVPAERYEAAVGELETIGDTVSRTRSAQDVTDEVVDVEARIETQQASIDRLQTLLGEATKIGDILAIETELTSRIAELESLQARQEQLGSLTQLATLTVTFVPPQTVVEQGSGFVAGLAAGWDAFVRAIEVGLTGLGVMLPFLAALALVAVPLLVWLVRRNRRRAHQRDAAVVERDDAPGGAPTRPTPAQQSGASSDG